MKKTINKLIGWLYFSIAVLTFFVAALLDTTTDEGFTVVMPFCFVGLVVVMIAYCLNSKPSKTDDNSAN